MKENNELRDKIKGNEATALKLLGAIETLEYLNPPAEEVGFHDQTGRSIPTTWRRLDPYPRKGVFS